MQQTFEDRFGPRWVMVIYLLSIMEAIGLSIYFQVRLPDPEMLSIDLLSAQEQPAEAAALARTGCPGCALVAGAAHQGLTRGSDIGMHASGRQRARR